MQKIFQNNIKKLIFQNKYFVVNGQKRSRLNYVEEHDTLFGKAPEQNLLSKQLQKGFQYEMRQKIKEQIDNEENINININDKPIQLIQKQENYQITAQKYNQFLRENPYGNINILNYKNTQYTLVGTQYQFLPIKNIYKMLRYSKPDAICLQIRPDQILNNFVINIKNPQTGYFSTTRYVNQIKKEGFQIMPSQLHEKKVVQHLENNNIFLSDKSSKQVNQKDIKYKLYTHKERLSQDTIATACFYAQRNNIPVFLCDLPEIVFRQDVANNHTLMQLQQIFKSCSKRIALEPDLIPHTPLSLAYNAYPNEFLHKSDHYISTFFQYLSATKKYKKVTAFLGNTQCNSIEDILLNQKTSHLADQLIPAEVKHSIVRDITAEEIIEKHSILDVMMHGKEIIQDIENLEFKSTYEIINRYGDPQKVDRKRITNLQYMHYKLLQKYQEFAQQEYSEGQRLLKQEFMKKVGYK